VTVKSYEIAEPLVVTRVRVCAVQQPTSGPHVLTTWRIDIAVADGAANARVHSTRPRIDFGPILVQMTDDIVAVAIKVLEAAHDHTV
jgi:anti-sigma regulatory factor (Ser/Thr protein kinase)